MNYTLEEVRDARQTREFLQLPQRLYAGNRNWVCPLDDDIEKVFDPQRNEKFCGGEAIRWIARNAQGEVVGRIAAFYNREQAAIEEQPTGGCGFFEAVNDQALADALFDAARDWLASKGMEAMDGPINFGDRDSWWGLLVSGFEFQPLYCNPYNPPYYQELFENYGWQNYFNQHTYSRKIKSGQLSEALYEKVRRLEEAGGYEFRHLERHELVDAAEDFRRIYNRAWARFSGVKPMDAEHARKLFRTLAPIVDCRLIYFAYFNCEPIGFFINIPDLNRVIGKHKGKFGVLQKLQTLWDIRRGKADRIFGLIFGVLPEYQGKGVESGLIRCMEKEIDRGSLRDYRSLELAWIGDFNPVMMRMVESYVCASRHKMHTTYRYLFDRTREFHRCPRLGHKKD